MTMRAFLEELVSSRLETDARAWLVSCCAELTEGATATRFCCLFSLASRHGTQTPLSPTEGELASAQQWIEGWNPERWTVLEGLRACLLLTHVTQAQFAGKAGAELVEEAFRYADVGESCALYRCLALLPDPGRFRWRAGEGARSNMRAIFEAACCDTPYPYKHFDDVAWNQVAVKAIFVEAPLWRVHGLDQRLSSELARMALDLADERRSAQRPVNPQLWICLGPHAGERGIESLQRELDSSHPAGRAAAAIALVRADAGERVRSRARAESDGRVQRAISSALKGRTDQRAFRSLDLSPQGTR